VHELGFKNVWVLKMFVLLLYFTIFEVYYLHC